MTTLTEEQFKQVLPPQLRRSVNQEILDRVNAVVSDPEVYESYRDNLVSYSGVLAQGKFKLQSYVDAVKYVSYKLMGNSNIDAYRKAFPDKIARFTQQQVSINDIHSYVTAYNKSKLVNLIFEQSMVPTWVLNQDLYQKALNTQAELMMNARSEKVRSDAANSILTHLKRPEKQVVELDIGIKEDSAIAALRESTMALVAQQRLAIQAGVMDAQQIAHSKVIQGTAEVVCNQQ